MVRKLFVFALFGSLALAQNLVQNPGFETGSFAPWVAQNWEVEMSDSGVTAHTGAFYSDTGCVGGTCIAPAPAASPAAWFYQDLATTASTQYTLTFYFASGEIEESGDQAELQVLWGPTATQLTTGGPGLCTGSCVYDNTTIGNTNYVKVTVGPLTATSASTRLEFLGRQDPAQMGIDDVCVATVGTANTVCNAVAPPATPIPPAIWLTMLGLACIGFYVGRGRLATV